MHGMEMNQQKHQVIVVRCSLLQYEYRQFAYISCLFLLTHMKMTDDFVDDSKIKTSLLDRG